MNPYLSTLPISSALESFVFTRARKSEDGSISASNFFKELRHEKKTWFLLVVLAVADSASYANNSKRISLEENASTVITAILKILDVIPRGLPDKPKCVALLPFAEEFAIGLDGCILNEHKSDRSIASPSRVQ